MKENQLHESKEECAKEKHKPSVTLETVFVSTLFLTHLAVPTQFLKSFRLHFIAQPFGCSNLSFTHFLKLKQE